MEEHLQWEGNMKGKDGGANIERGDGAERAEAARVLPGETQQVSSGRRVIKFR